MALIKNIARELLYNRRGQDLIEYALLSGFVAVAAGAIFPTSLIPGVSAIFSRLADYFTQASAQGTGS